MRFLRGRGVQSSSQPPGASMNNKNHIRILVADRSLVVRKGLIVLIKRQVDMKVVGEASHGQEVVDLFRRLQPDVTLLDLRMSGIDGMVAMRVIQKQHPGAHIIVLTTSDGDED